MSARGAKRENTVLWRIPARPDSPFEQLRPWEVEVRVCAFAGHLVGCTTRWHCEEPPPCGRLRACQCCSRCGTSSPRRRRKSSSPVRGPCSRSGSSGSAITAPGTVKARGVGWACALVPPAASRCAGPRDLACRV